MQVSAYWPKCDFRAGQWGTAGIDAFWVTCTKTEAETRVFPSLGAEQQARSIDLAEHSAQIKDPKIIEMMGDPPRCFCFLVAKDLSAIDPFPFTYPFHELWAGDSPFVPFGPIAINELADVQRLNIEQRDARRIAGEASRRRSPEGVRLA